MYIYSRWSQGLVFHHALVDFMRSALLIPLGIEPRSELLLLFCQIIHYFKLWQKWYSISIRLPWRYLKVVAKAMLAVSFHLVHQHKNENLQNSQVDLIVKIVFGSKNRPLNRQLLYHKSVISRKLLKGVFKFFIKLSCGVEFKSFI